MTNPNDQFSDFLSQLPVGLFATVCLSISLLFVAFAWFVYFKPLLRARRNNQNSASKTFVGGQTIDNSDLPDLFALLDTSTLEHETPKPAPAAEINPEPTAPPTQQPITVAKPTDAIQWKKSGAYSIRLNTGANIQADEVISILRDPRDNRLVVYLDNTGYRTLADTPEIKQKFVKIMQELSNVVAEPDELDPLMTLDDNQLIEEPEPIIESTPAPQPRKSAPPPPVDTTGTMPGDLPSFRLEDSVIPTPRGKYQAAPVPELNIAASIEAYLQHKLKHTGDFSGRQIHVQSAPGGGVRIQVDAAIYEAVDEVADLEVRDFLTDTIQEWQDRQ